jgi:hypothetical protein
MTPGEVSEDERVVLEALCGFGRRAALDTRL